MLKIIFQTASTVKLLQISLQKALFLCFAQHRPKRNSATTCNSVDWMMYGREKLKGQNAFPIGMCCILGLCPASHQDWFSP